MAGKGSLWVTRNASGMRVHTPRINERITGSANRFDESRAIKHVLRMECYAAILQRDKLGAVV
ncbi:MAG: hypothetical protein ACREAC_07370, partial [Blastocatellia bacterium]